MEIDRIHFYVKDAAERREWFRQRMGFQPIGSIKSDNARTEILLGGSVYWLVSSPLTSSSPVARYLESHPDGIADVAFRVRDLESFLTKAIGAGDLLQPLQKRSFEIGTVKWAKIRGWGSLSHTLIETEIDPKIEKEIRPESIEEFYHFILALEADGCQIEIGEAIELESKKLSSHVARTARSYLSPGSIDFAIDHLVLNVASGDLEKASCYYQKLFGFQVKQVFDIQTERSGLYSQVLEEKSDRFWLNINEPTSANSQIQEFLDWNRGSGIQHIALRVTNLVETVALLRDRGLSFLSAPPTYYRQLRQRCEDIPVPLDEREWNCIEELQILLEVKRDSPSNLLLQIFTQPIFKEPTFFFEFISRRGGAYGFGQNNFRALFEAIELEQSKRNNLLAMS
ncbi:MAG: 4-hydroxyphenylpyruvate dioxygenase [Oscillatoria sp. SIO1A7]|nr:4-hydroxyphenylpyruvate dioxygenase [Oscillatoria sp. SIO1A7]